MTRLAEQIAPAARPPEGPADRYADALVQAVGADGAAEVSAEIDALLRVAKDEPGGLTLLTGATLSPAAHARSVGRALAGNVREDTEALVRLLAERGQGHLLPEVARALHERLDRAAGRFEVTVTSAVPLTDPQRREAEAAVGDALGERAMVKTQVNPSLLGGMTVQVGDILLDDSVAARLRSLREELGGGPAAAGEPEIRTEQV